MTFVARVLRHRLAPGSSLVVLATVVVALTGCSGGDDSSSGDGGPGVDAQPGALQVTAGDDQTVYEPADSVSLTAIVSGEGAAAATPVWTQVAGGEVTLVGTDTLTLMVSGLTLGDYTFRVTVTGAAGELASDDVSVTVLPDNTACVGATFHISPSGNDDTGDGSEGAPWRTLAKATQSVTTAGSTIHVAAGTYSESEQSRLAPGVCLEGEGNASVITSTISDDFAAVIVAESPEGTDGHQHISNLRFDGGLTTWWGIYVAGRSNFSIHNCTIIDFLDRGVVFSGREDTEEGPPGIYATGNSFHHNQVHNSARYTSYGTGGLNIGGQEGMLVYANTLTQLDRPLGENGWPLKYWSGGWLRGVKVYDNVITKIPFHGEFGGDGGWDFAIELFNVSGLEIYGNTIQGSVDLNWQTKSGYPYSVHLHDNVIGQPVLSTQPESGIVFEFGTETAIVENNEIRNVSIGISFNTRADDVVSDITIRRNLIANIGFEGRGHGLSGGTMGFFPEGGTSYSVRNFAIINNTFVANADNNPWWGIQFENGAAAIDGVQVINNISANFEGGWFVTNFAITDLEVKNNNGFNCGNDDEPLFTEAAPPGAVIADNLKVDPLFVSTTDFTLRPGSMCIDAGVDVGLPFEGGAPDLGYAEYAAP